MKRLARLATALAAAAILSTGLMSCEYSGSSTSSSTPAGDVTYKCGCGKTAKAAAGAAAPS